jgi:hypothetical protein
LNSTASVSSANLAFDIGIRDAEELLKHFDNAYELPRPPENAEVLKRAGLIMACTAWRHTLKIESRKNCDAVSPRKATVATRFIGRKLNEEPGRQRLIS